MRRTGQGVTGKGGTGRLVPPRLLPVDRRRIRVAVVIAALALVVAAVGAVLVWRTPADTTAAERDAVRTAAAEAVTAVMTAGAGVPADHPRRTLDRLTDPLRLDYRSRGADVVLPGATASRVSLRAVVVGTGVHRLAADEAQVLVFADLRAQSAEDTTDRAGRPEHTATARWATMRKVDGNWLLADLQPVGDITR